MESTGLSGAELPADKLQSMNAAKALLAGHPAAASPRSKLNVVSFAGKAQPEGSPGGPRIPAGQPRKWLRIDEQGKSAYIKVQSC